MVGILANLVVSVSVVSLKFHSHFGSAFDMMSVVMLMLKLIQKFMLVPLSKL